MIWRLLLVKEWKKNFISTYYKHEKIQVENLEWNSRLQRNYRPITFTTERPLLLGVAVSTKIGIYVKSFIRHSLNNSKTKHSENIHH